VNLSQTCIQRPVLAIVLSLIIAILGFVAFNKLQLRFYPDLVMPVVTIHTTYTGASAELMESQVTTLMENALSGINNVDTISSSSYSGNSSITINFRLGGNFESEAADVRDAVSGIRDKLPSDINPPTITVGKPGQELIDIGITDKYKSPAEIRDYTHSYLLPAFQQIAGVGRIGIVGSSPYAVRIWLDPLKMAAVGLTVTDVQTALTSNNINFSAGYVSSSDKNYSIVSDTELKSLDQFKKIIVHQAPNATIRLSDIANVTLGTTSLQNTPMIINGQSGVKIYIEPVQSANPITVAKLVTDELATIQKSLPPGMQASVIYNQANYLKDSIDETVKAVFEAVILVIIVIFLFLGSFRSTIIPVVTIPLSLIGVLALIYVLGFSLNVMSLLAMVLAIGLVVDDAIVMVENIHRHIEEGKTALKAALQGSKEIFYAIIAMSITLVAVYAPLGMIQGVDAALFQQFAFTLAGAVIISAFIAVTLSPMMCANILKAEAKASRFSQWVDHIFEKANTLYARLLRRVIKHKLIVFGLLALIAVVGVVLFKALPSEFLPQEDYGIIEVSVSTPTGTNLTYTKKYMQKIGTIMSQTPDVVSMYTQVNPSSISVRAILKPFNERKLSTQDIINQLNAKFALIPGVTAMAYVPDLNDFGDTGSDVTYNLLTTGSYTTLLPSINKLMTALKQNPQMQSVATNLRYDAQEYSVTINRDLAANLGVSLTDISTTMSTMLSGNHMSDVTAGTQSYEILVQMKQSELSSLNAINHIYMATPPDANGKVKMVPLSSLVTIKPIIAQGTLTHYNRMRSGYINIRLAPGYAESQAINYLNSHLDGVLTGTIHGAYSGKAEQYIQSSGTMANIVIMAFIFIYLILSAQFGSFIDPFIILFAVPFSIVGALLFLWVGGGSINLYSEIGMVTLIGLISKHGILITQFINQSRTADKPIVDTIIEGATIRLRPVLMTTAAMVFGTLPLALADGAGSVGRHEIGWVIVGGLLCGTFFSLLVVPMMYDTLARFKKKPSATT
jgi:hydrophobe/amphiphile efflux-1 (HAE1) family protein